MHLSVHAEICLHPTACSCYELLLGRKQSSLSQVSEDALVCAQYNACINGVEARADLWMPWELPSRTCADVRRMRYSVAAIHTTPTHASPHSQLLTTTHALFPPTHPAIKSHLPTDPPTHPAGTSPKTPSSKSHAGQQMRVPATPTTQSFPTFHESPSASVAASLPTYAVSRRLSTHGR